MQSTNTGHKYITYSKKRDEYIVSFDRDRQSFKNLTSTLDDAIELRDRALKFYETHGRVPTRQDLGLVRRVRRTRKSSRLDTTVECKNCSRQLKIRYPRDLKEFEKNGEICGFCRRDKSNQMKLEDAKGQLNEKYIIVESSNASGRKYRVTIVKFNQMFSKSFNRLEDAVKIRDEVVDFYNGFGRLPNLEEQQEIFGVKIRSKKNLDVSSRSKNSSSKLKNISLSKDSDRCYVQIRRDRKKFSTSCKSLEDATRVREAVLEFYDEFSRLPTRSEHRQRMKERNS